MARDRRANQGISPGFNIANSALTTDWLLLVPGTNLPTGYHINMPRHKKTLCLDIMFVFTRSIYKRTTFII